MFSTTSRRLLLRIDDAGLNLDTNRGIEAAARAGFARSVSIMACAPAFGDAAQRLRDLPNLAIGVHLTLNSEWINWRWSPVLPAKEVPTLVDEAGLFPLDHQFHRQRPPAVSDVVAELRAQIARVRAAGLNPSYADEHMGFAGVNPFLANPVRDLLAEEGLLYARDARLHAIRQETSPESKATAWASAIASTPPGDYLLVTHPAAEGAGIHALTLPGKQPGTVSAARIAEGKALTSPSLGSLLAATGTILISYADLR